MNKSLIEKKSVVLHGHKTSCSIEKPYQQALKDIADRRNLTVTQLINLIDADRTHKNLSSAIRLFVLADLQARINTRTELLASAAKAMEEQRACT